jgi:hypothetical protein
MRGIVLSGIAECGTEVDIDPKELRDGTRLV